MRQPRREGSADPIVLIVDDDMLVARGVARILRGRCHACIAGGALAALEHFAGGPIAAIISDYRMPGHDGLWLLEEVRLRSSATIRILCSGSPPQDLQHHLTTGRVQHFLPKPVCLGALREALCGVLD